MERDGRRSRERDPLLWIALAGCSGAGVVTAPWPTLLASGVVAVLLLRDGRRVAVALAAAALLLGHVRARAAVERHERARAEVAAAGRWPARCTVAGAVARSPVELGGALRIEVERAELRCEGGPDDRAVAAAALERSRIALHVPPEALTSRGVPERGAAVLAVASLAPPYRFWNDGTADPRPREARRGVVLSGGAEDVTIVRPGAGPRAWIDRMRARARARIHATFPPATSGMARALVLGEDDLAVEDGLAFRRSGLAHLLAVSGMHLVLVVVGLVGVVRALLVRVPPVAARIDAARIASAAGIPAAWLYADFAGGSGSALRAAWMCSAVLAARVAARRPDTLRALSLSLGGMALLSPLALHDLSFVLSALATIGLLALAEPIELLLAAALARARLRPARADTERRVRSFVLRPVATTAAATVACAPVLATMAPELPLAGLVANLLAVPLGEAAALPLCLVHGLLEGWPAAEAGAAAAASGALALVRGVAHAFTWGGLPVPPPSPAQLAVLAAAAAGAALGDARRWVALGASALALAELAIRADAAPRGELRVTFLDVGQGDAALVDLPDGSAILVDGGGLVGSPVDVGERVVAPVLAARRRSSLAAVVLSHPHPDHHLGLPAAIARARPAAFWDTGQGEAEGAVGAYAGLLASVRGAGIPVLGPADLCGSRTIGGAIVDVLAPCPAHVPDRGPNDNSLVVRLRLDRRAILLVGDAEHVEEDELVARRGGAGLRADVLKVGHHGSRTSTTPSFLAAVAPRAAVISCGVRNRFGHPHVATLDTLGRAGVRVLRTDRDGGVVVRTDGRSLDVRAMAE